MGTNGTLDETVLQLMNFNGFVNANCFGSLLILPRSKSLRQAIDQFFLVDPYQREPEDLISAVDTFIAEKEVTSHEADKINETLKSVFDTRVAGQSRNLPTFLDILHQFIPVLQQQHSSKEWYHILVKGVVLEAHIESSTLELAKRILLDLLLPTSDNTSTSSYIRSALLAAYFDSHNKDLEDVVLMFASKSTLEFFLEIQLYFTKKIFRLPTTELVTKFASNQGPHLHKIMDTRLFTYLLFSLESDRDSLCIVSGLKLLVYILPHVSNALSPYVIQIFNTCARCLCWDTADTNLPLRELPDKSWEIYGSEKDAPSQDQKRVTDHVMLDASQLFTFLYGLYPLNFVSFLRDPIKYLASKGWNDAIGFDEEILRTRSLVRIAEFWVFTDKGSIYSANMLCIKTSWSILSKMN